jgi:hypothetical protein
MTTYHLQNKDATKADHVIVAKSPADALRMHLHHVIGKGWSFSRNTATGWIIASPSNNKQLERIFYKIREANWTRGMVAI